MVLPYFHIPFHISIGGIKQCNAGLHQPLTVSTYNEGRSLSKIGAADNAPPFLGMLHCDGGNAMPHCLAGQFDR